MKNPKWGMVLIHPQLSQNWRDRTIRGKGNKAARRAFLSALRADKNLRGNLAEPIANYDRILTRGAILTDCCTSADTAKFSHY
jgi:hypothetical protein